MIESIQTIVFQRTFNSKNEEGLLLNEGDLGIIDSNGEKLSGMIYRYTTIVGLQIFNLHIGGKKQHQLVNKHFVNPTKYSKKV